MSGSWSEEDLQRLAANVDRLRDDIADRKREPDPRDAELAMLREQLRLANVDAFNTAAEMTTLRSKLDDALKVIKAVRAVVKQCDLRCGIGPATCKYIDRMVDAVDDYTEKHGVK